MTRRQPPLSFTAVIITVLLTGANVNVSAFVPANYRNPSLGQKKVVDVFPSGSSNQLPTPTPRAFALKQPGKNALTRSTISTSERQSSTSLQMVAPTGAALAAITGAMTGGLFAGGLHAMSGKCCDYVVLYDRLNDRLLYRMILRSRITNDTDLAYLLAYLLTYTHTHVNLSYLCHSHSQDRITWQHSYLDAVVSVGTEQEPSVLSGAWDTESPPLSLASWPLP